MMIPSKVTCRCGRRLWWVERVRHWVPPYGRETEADLIEACTPGQAIPTACPECRDSLPRK